MLSIRATRSAATVLAVVLASCGTGTEPTSEDVYLEEARSELSDVFGEEVPEYTDEELLSYGERACGNLADLEDGDDLRRSIEAASVGSSESETLQIAQATVIVTTAARHLCPEQGERLDLFEEDASA